MAGLISLNVPAFLQAFNHLSPLKYAVANMIPFSLQHVEFTCLPAQRLPNGQCPIQNGKQVLETYGFNGSLNTAWKNLGYLVVVTVAYRLLGWAVLKGRRWRFGIVGR